MNDDQNKRHASILELPNSLVEEVLEFLQVSQLLSCGRVNKQTRQLVRNMAKRSGERYYSHVDGNIETWEHFKAIYVSLCESSCGRECKTNTSALGSVRSCPLCHALVCGNCRCQCRCLDPDCPNPKIQLISRYTQCSECGGRTHLACRDRQGYCDSGFCIGDGYNTCTLCDPVEVCEDCNGNFCYYCIHPCTTCYGLCCTGCLARCDKCGGPVCMECETTCGKCKCLLHGVQNDRLL